MWIFQHLLDETIDPALLLDPALACARRRVVVKRPGRAPVLGDREPHFQLGGKTVRFDVYTAS
jgi:16S rRNA (guanine1516-N2)-methyltransferase